MLCPPLRPLNRRPNVPNLPDPHRARPSRAAGSFFDVNLPVHIATLEIGRMVIVRRTAGTGGIAGVQGHQGRLSLIV